MDKHEKEFLGIFQKLSQRHSAWNVWHDFIFLSATALSNQIDKRPGIWHKRENEYLRIIKRYDKNEQSDIPTLLALATASLQDNPAQDFLGRLFMALELSNHWKGQFFTPYDVADMMTRVTVGDGSVLKEKIRQNGFVSACDPTCGSGVMFIAFANRCRELGIDPSKDVLLIGEDIDETAALTCYIQLCLLGCVGSVTIGDALAEPVYATIEERTWVTPAYMLKLRDIYSKKWRRQ